METFFLEKERHEGMHFSMVMTISEAMRWDTKMLDHEAVILEKQNIFCCNYYMLIGFLFYFVNLLLHQLYLICFELLQK